MRKTMRVWQAALMTFAILLSCLLITASATRVAGIEDRDIMGMENSDLLLCNNCGETEFFWIYDIPEYAPGGKSLMEDGVAFADSSWLEFYRLDGSTVEIIPGCGDDAYTGHHWRITMCLNCGSLNGDLPVDGYGFWDKMYRLEQCPVEHMYEETGCVPADDEHHLVTGVDTAVCPWCGEKQSQQTAFLVEHDWSTETTEPTCTQRGYTIFTCRRCGDSYRGNETEVTGHQFGGWIIDKEPTIDDEGSRSRVCQICGEMEMEILPKLTPEPNPNPISTPDPNPSPDPDPEPEPDLVSVRHNAYIGGLPGDIFDPSRPMTRTEAAIILTRLLKGEMPPLEEQIFDDTIITRAEFTAVVVALFDETEKKGMAEVPFPDVPANHWATGAIQRAKMLRWLRGDTNGLARPDSPITRAEAVVMLNRVLDRQPDRAYMDAHVTELRVFTDVRADHWAWYDILEATNGHDAFLEQQETSGK